MCTYAVVQYSGSFVARQWPFARNNAMYIQLSATGTARLPYTYYTELCRAVLCCCCVCTRMLQSQCNKEATTAHISQYTRVDGDKSIKQFLQLPVVCIMFVYVCMRAALTG